LVTKNYIALAELIKNSYDADAKSVTITIRNSRSDKFASKGHIIVKDTGLGMSFQQINDFWMKIATDNKLREPITPIYGRKKTGNKGIGRFACRKLGSKLLVESTSQLENGLFETTIVTFIWGDYVPGTTLDQIPNKYFTKVTKEGQFGTKLTIVGLSEKWTQRDFNTLRRRILELSVVSPTKRKGYKEDPGFIIELIAPEFEQGKGLLKEQAMNAGWGRLKGTVNENGIVKLSLDANKIGVVIYELPKTFEEIANTSFDIAVIWRRYEHLKDPNMLTGGIIDEIFEHHSGVKVFLEGFRVYPYGDPGNDWLNIDEIQARRLTTISDIFSRVVNNLIGVNPSRARLYHPRNQNLLGSVFLTNKDKLKFISLVNREGFIENEAFMQLKECLQDSLEWLTIYYAYFQELLNREIVKESSEEFRELLDDSEKRRMNIMANEPENIILAESAVNILEKLSESYTVTLEKDERVEYKKRTDAASSVIKNTISHLEKQTNNLRTIASTGALMFVFTHEAQNVISSLDTHSNALEMLAKKNPTFSSDLLFIANSFRETRDRFDNQIELFGTLSKDIRDIKKKKLSILNAYKKVNNIFKGLIIDFNINIDADGIMRSHQTGDMLEAELFSILINVISNAIKAVLAEETSNKKIKLETKKTENGISLYIYDDGVGIPSEYWNIITQPLVSDPEGKIYKKLEKILPQRQLNAVGTGMGLGLSIVKDILESYNKQLRFIEPELPWKTCVVIELP